MWVLLSGINLAIPSSLSASLPPSLPYIISLSLSAPLSLLPPSPSLSLPLSSPLCPSIVQDYEPTSAFDLYTEGYSDFDGTLPSLAELSLADAKYQTVCLNADSSGQFGVTLRFFSIQPVAGPPVSSS